MSKILKIAVLRISSFVLALMMISGLGTVSAYAAEKGTFTVPLIVTYANPETGEIVDGGSNEALGNSMCQSVMQADALIENTGETAYVTLGFGLASNISNIEVQLQKTAGVNEYETVTLTETGSCQRDDDTCIHYRFEMSDPSLLISPILFVDPMGRNVQFFIRLDMDNAAEGTGNYLSEMMVEEEPEAVEEIQPVEESAEEVTEPEAEPEIEEAGSLPSWVIPAAAAGAVIIIAAGIIIWKVRKQRKGEQQ